MEAAYLGVVGLGVMGTALARNMARQGFAIAGLDRGAEKAAGFAGLAAGLSGFSNNAQFAAALQSPRRILMMVPAGAPVDSVIAALSPLLSAGDLLIDGGNSFFADTERRAAELAKQGIQFLGVGVSGGQHGALWGPSMMPGGPLEAWEAVEPLLSAIAARVDGDPCVAYLGPGGAGHYVKMVHNGIEYADMQLIAEAYDLLHRGLGHNAQNLHEIFRTWNQGKLASYLVEISAEIFARRDPASGTPLLDLILDEAQQKGTGKWTTQNALDLGVATPTINAAVEARLLSALKDERLAAAKVLQGPKAAGKPPLSPGEIGEALYAAKVIAFAQGFALLKAASVEYQYQLDLATIARIWRGGCIIRAALLEEVKRAFIQNPELGNLLMDEQLGEAVGRGQRALRRVVAAGVQRGIALPAFSSALAYYDAYRAARLPANLTQAQRDYFGAHSYQRLDQEGRFHTDWVDLQQPPG